MEDPILSYLNRLLVTRLCTVVRYHHLPPSFSLIEDWSWSLLYLYIVVIIHTRILLMFVLLGTYSYCSFHSWLRCSELLILSHFRRRYPSFFQILT
nr:hypothetical protein Q903MT_gene1974 [Picea sitchensis]